ncbi:MAG TPA: hypothetical protein DC046_01345 [Rhodospirillaceae bacterium]|nr:hypothetical protein [Rhodospirillaceae bacterium]
MAVDNLSLRRVKSLAESLDVMRFEICPTQAGKSGNSIRKAGAEKFVVGNTVFVPLLAIQKFGQMVVGRFVLGLVLQKSTQQSFRHVVQPPIQGAADQTFESEGRIFREDLRNCLICIAVADAFDQFVGIHAVSLDLFVRRTARLRRTVQVLGECNIGRGI